MTEREKILLQREAYANGLFNSGKYGAADANWRAIEKYPMPKKKVARVVEVCGGDIFRCHPKWGHLEQWNDEVGGWEQPWACIADFQLEELEEMVYLMRNPYIEVDDDE